MFKKTVEGVRNLLNKMFGKKHKGNKKFSELRDELPQDRRDKIDKLTEKLLKGIEQAENGEVVENKDFPWNKVEGLKEKHSDTLQSLGGDGLMHMSKKGMIELAGHEGICLTKYKDSVGVWTIGVGATRTEIPDIARWPQDKSITVEEAFELMKKSIVKYEKGVRRALKVDVPQHTFDALVSWCYNVGTGWMKKASVIKLLNKGVSYKDKRVYNALMMFKKPREIIRRRTKEAVLLTTGVYSNKGRALLFPVSKKGSPVYSKGKTIDVNKYL